MKRLLSALLILCITAGLLSAIPFTADAYVPDEYEYEGIYCYYIRDAEAVIQSASGASGDITIPGTLGGHKVTGIDIYAFYQCRNLTSVVIPEGVTWIGDNAFRQCTSLTSISLPNSLTSMGTNVFTDCNKLMLKTYDKGAYLGNTSNPFLVLYKSTNTNTPSLTIHPNTRIIAVGALRSCCYLSTISIPKSVVQIGDGAFSECSNLSKFSVAGDNPNYSSDSYGVLFNKNKTVLIQSPGFLKGAYIVPDTVQTIQSCAFLRCDFLTSVTIPKSVTSIGERAFIGNRLTAFWVNADNPNYSSDNTGALFNKNKTVLIQVPGNCAGSFTVPKSVTTIEDSAFEMCQFLTSVTICEGVSVIGKSAFNACTSMTSITIPKSVTYLRGALFDNCYSLKTITFAGNETQWQTLTKGFYDHYLNQATVVCQGAPEGPDYGEVTSWNLILKEDIGVKFQFSFTELIEQDTRSYVEVKVGDSTQTHMLYNMYYGLTVNIPASQMTDQIRISIVSSKGTRDELGTYSIKAYADEILSGDFSNATKQMVQCMLTYGAMAQKYFGHNEDTLANGGINCHMVSVPKAAPTEMGVTNALDTITFYGASLRYGNKIALRYYFEADNINAYTFTANGKRLYPVAKDGRYYVEIPDILPQNIGSTFSVSVADSGGETMTVSYSPMNYIVRMYHKTDTTGDCKNLLQALYTYYLAARSYTA